MKRLAALAAIFIALGALLAGCSGQAAQESKPGTTQSTTSQPEAQPTTSTTQSQSLPYNKSTVGILTIKSMLGQGFCDVTVRLLNFAPEDTMFFYREAQPVIKPTAKCPEPHLGVLEQKVADPCAEKVEQSPGKVILPISDCDIPSQNSG